MKLSVPTILLVVLLVNLFVAGMGLMDSIVQSSEESVLMTSMPVDWRNRLPRDSEADSAFVVSSSRSAQPER